MDSPIIPIDMIQKKARAQFARGAGRDDHGFNWHCVAAIDTWQDEWDRCEAEFNEAFDQLAEACPP